MGIFKQMCWKIIPSPNVLAFDSFDLLSSGSGPGIFMFHGQYGTSKSDMSSSFSYASSITTGWSSSTSSGFSSFTCGFQAVDSIGVVFVDFTDKSNGSKSFCAAGGGGC